MTRLPDDVYQLSPGRRVRSYSVEHLRADNIFGNNLSADQLADRLGEIRSQETVHRLAARLRKLDQAAPEDGELVSAAVRLGWGWGVSAAWGVCPDADYMWAAAAMILEARGVQHPNELTDTRQRAA